MNRQDFRFFFTACVCAGLKWIRDWIVTAAYYFPLYVIYKCYLSNKNNNFSNEFDY